MIELYCMVTDLIAAWILNLHVGFFFKFKPLPGEKNERTLVSQFAIFTQQWSKIAYQKKKM